MEPFLVSLFVVALAELGDKTQLLAIVLAARFKQPVPIILGILCATAANHLLAALGGYYLADFLAGPLIRPLLAVGFMAMGLWALTPERAQEQPPSLGGYGAFLTTLVAFFLVEMGDKTQIATVALAARFHAVLRVAAGTTIGMLLADIPAVFLAEAASKIAPLRYVRFGTAILFFALGLWTLGAVAV